MICSALATLTSSDARGVRNAHVNSFAQRALVCGSRMNELYSMSELNLHELDQIHYGKEASILDMLAGGNGFPPSNSVAWQTGATLERGDLRSLLTWQADKYQCLHDRARGATS